MDFGFGDVNKTFTFGFMSGSIFSLSGFLTIVLIFFMVKIGMEDIWIKNEKNIISNLFSGCYNSQMFATFFEYETPKVVTVQVRIDFFKS